MSMRNVFVVAVLTVALFSLGATGCGGYKTKLCCNSEESEGYGEAPRSYCNDYAVAVAGFLRKPDTEKLRTQQRELFKRFLAGLQACSAIACIEHAVDTSTLVPDFDAIFDREHSFAQDRPIGGEAERVRLLLCGFEHGLGVSLQ